MTTKRGMTAIIAVVCLGVLGCAGLRFSETAPEARDFHPEGVAVLSVDTTAFAEAKGKIGPLFTEVLVEQKWFSAVVGLEAVNRRMASDEAFRKTVDEYLAKRAKVSFSDPELSRRIGEMTGTDAFLLVRVDSWNDTTEKERKLAKVGLSVTMIGAKTGELLWTASHQKVSEYFIMKPDLSGMARDLIREMIGYMPH